MFVCMSVVFEYASRDDPMWLVDTITAKLCSALLYSCWMLPWLVTDLEAIASSCYSCG